MKKKILFGACTALFLGAGIATAIRTSPARCESDMVLSNIEALAKVEENKGYWTVEKITEAHKDGSVTIYCDCKDEGGPLPCC